MADEVHLEILKQGIQAWNTWRKQKPEQPDLRNAELRRIDLSSFDLGDCNLAGADLREANLSRANLSRVILTDAHVSGSDLSETKLIGALFRNTDLIDSSLIKANLRGANLSRSDLSNADLHNAELCDAYLGSAVLRGVVLRSADLSRAILRGADCRRADLRDANLTEADLRNTILTDADLRGVNLERAKFDSTVLGFIDLQEAKGLGSVLHRGPSALSVDVLKGSRGQLPAKFLKGCGLSDWEIENAKIYDPELSEDERTTLLYEISRLQGEQPIQVNPLFISYSHPDAVFIEQLEPQFEAQGIRFWRDVHDLRAGRLETQIDRAIRLNPTVLLVLSEHSVDSDWVEWEAAKARKLEKELGRDVLCPVALDNAWKTCSWSGPLRRQIMDYHILDFSDWQDASTFERQFTKLLDGLKLFYRPMES